VVARKGWPVCRHSVYGDQGGVPERSRDPATNAIPHFSRTSFSCGATRPGPAGRGLERRVLRHGTGLPPPPNCQDLDQRGVELFDARARMTSMIRKEEIEQTKADDRSNGASGPVLGRCPDC
jgi:hypothetical protein